MERERREEEREDGNEEGKKNVKGREELKKRETGCRERHRRNAHPSLSLFSSHLSFSSLLSAKRTAISSPPTSVL
jgi:hypothetical protein